MEEIFFDDLFEQNFDRDGILNIPLLDADEVASLISVYQNEFSQDGSTKFHSTMFINDPVFRKKTDDAIRKIVSKKIEKVLRNYRLLFANFIVKESSSETGVGIHQDWNFTTPEYTSLNIWIPLVDIDRSTGFFYALKGSHKTFQNIRYTPYPDNAYTDIRDYVLKRSSLFSPGAGEALVYNGALIHFSEPNLSGRLRIAIGMALIPRDAPCRHYYKRNPTDSVLEIYETNEVFYNQFDFFEEPRGVKKIGLVYDFKELPSKEELIRQKAF